MLLPIVLSVCTALEFATGMSVVMQSDSGLFVHLEPVKPPAQIQRQALFRMTEVPLFSQA